MDTRLAVGKLPGTLLAHLLSANSIEDPDVLVGPGVGRDAAVLRIGGQIVVVKSDPITFASTDATAYLVDVNANDLACLGATPRWMLVTALFAEGTTIGDVEAQFHQLITVCARRNISLVGGHTEVTPGIDRTILSGTLIGEATPTSYLAPGGASPGDVLIVTRGVAIEGSALIAREADSELARLIGREAVGRAANLLSEPGISIINDAGVLGSFPGITALHDPTEGGLGTAVRELAIASGCGARIVREKIPVLAETRLIADALGLDPLGMLASGCLLASADPSEARNLVAEARASRVPAAIIGELLAPELGFTLFTANEPDDLPEWPTDEVSRGLRILSSVGSPPDQA